MKAIYTLFSVSLFTSIWFNVAQSSELEGIWRGPMEIQPGVNIVIGVRIESDQLFLESPNQGMFDREPTSFEVTDEQVSFTDEGLSASFSGSLEGGVLKGEFQQGRTYELNLTKLDEQALVRMEAYEGQYAGDLVLNGRTSLPLVLHIVVVNDGYLATLDSPAQQSFGIPITELDVSAEALSFESPMIQASYESTFNGELYEGRFLQGQARTLNLKKLQRGEPHTAQTNEPEVGAYGGAVAVLNGSEVDYEYFANHSSETQYEIGSVTKTMVSYILAQALVAEQVTEQTKITEIWPGAMSSPTLIDLATHFSGLPRLPHDLLSTADINNPYQHYDAEMLAEALRTTEAGEPVYEYSNFGYGVLAEALAAIAIKPFATLLNESVFQPLDMQNSYVALHGQSGVNALAQGHSVTDAVPAWTFDALAGAGAVVATLPDMVKYVRAMQAAWAAQTPLAKRLLTPIESLGGNTQQALGWIIATDPEGKSYAWHNGQTAGFSSFVAFYLDGSKAVVVLNNQAINVNDFALRKLFND
ncbi:MAG: putative beta-lactamase [Idiomarinaceae bacterium HL-53]|nr:MAG: putative beta-lactamase [Idiomarinaceae bacterium HL-53]CUS48160.1 CubicO group peptidase, beta-lactamase class C family [Idiomarinaceae bacterium HL-53]